MKIDLGFGQGQQSVDIPDANLGEIILPAKMEMENPEGEIIRAALGNPVGTGTLDTIVGRNDSVVLVTSDITRPMPTYKVLPLLLDELNAAGVPDSRITLVFGLGSHRRQTEKEMRKLAGDECFERITCMDSDPEDVVSLGITTRGTPVDIHRAVVQADKRICLGNIEYHYFAGYSGGYKALMPGVSTFSAIQKNHSHMVKAQAAAGRLEGNPVREDIEETAGFIKIDFLFNVVLDEHKQIVGAFAGDPVKAHRKGCEFLDRLYGREIKTRADIVIVSAGGFPKDINLYQAQKALDNSKYAVKSGGIIILAAACTEGLGGESFEEWMINFEKPGQMVEEIQRNFILGGHKAAAIGLILETTEIYLVSDMDPAFVETIFMKPFPDVQHALKAALLKKGKNAVVHVMPYGGSLLPHCPSDSKQ